jgi:hypothetical protein
MLSKNTYWEYFIHSIFTENQSFFYLDNIYIISTTGIYGLSRKYFIHLWKTVFHARIFRNFIHFFLLFFLPGATRTNDAKELMYARHFQQLKMTKSNSPNLLQTKNIEFFPHLKYDKVKICKLFIQISALYKRSSLS